VTRTLGPAEADAEIAARGLAWRREGDMLVKQVDRGDFAGALAYVNQVGALAEQAGHHPDIDIRWGTVVLALSTHSAGGLTERDLSLAARVDALDPPVPPVPPDAPRQQGDERTG
jgi:4a-hydroxytetrahydrobiopterin dehydratase